VLNVHKYGKSVTTNPYGDYTDDLYALGMPRGTVKRMKNTNEYKKVNPQTWKRHMKTRKA